MLKISKLADYAVLIMHCLSQHMDERYSAAAVSERIGIAAPTVSKILKLLNEAKLVTSTRGTQGGYQLARASENMSLADIVTAIDGSPAMTECSQVNGCCQYDQHCELRSNWQYINDIIFKVLNHVTLRDMMTPLSHSKLVASQFYPAALGEDNYDGK